MKKIARAPFGLVGITAGLGIADKAFPGVGLDKAGGAASKFIAPAINISVGGHLINQLKKLKRR